MSQHCDRGPRHISESLGTIEAEIEAAKARHPAGRRSASFEQLLLPEELMPQPR